MENLSPLNVKCFANMQMILDSLSVSMPKLESLMDPFYDKFEELLKKECFPIGYVISDNWKRGTIYALGHNTDYKERYLEEIIPEIQLLYTIPIEQNKKRNPLKFEIEFGYLCDEEQNTIYFQLFEVSEKIGIITESFASDLILSIPKDWQTGITENSVYVEFTVNENMSKEKINECADIFNRHVLLPFIYKLKQ